MVVARSTARRYDGSFTNQGPVRVNLLPIKPWPPALRKSLAPDESTETCWRAVVGSFEITEYYPLLSAVLVT